MSTLKVFLNTPVGGIKESNSLPVNFHPKGGLWITPDKSASFALLSRLIYRGLSIDHPSGEN